MNPLLHIDFCILNCPKFYMIKSPHALFSYKLWIHSTYFFVKKVAWWVTLAILTRPSSLSQCSLTIMSPFLYIDFCFLNWPEFHMIKIFLHYFHMNCESILHHYRRISHSLIHIYFTSFCFSYANNSYSSSFSQ